MLPRLQNYANQRAGVVAIQDSRLVGFIVGLLIQNRGVRTAYIPDWGHATSSSDSKEIYRLMYAALSPRWVTNGYFTHAITIFAHEYTTSNAWVSLGFGQTTIDALRNLNPVQGSAAEVEIRRATTEDIDQVFTLAIAMQRHMSGAPIFIPLIIYQNRQWTQKWLSDSANALWLAYHNGATVGFMGLQPSNPNAAVLPVSDKTFVAFNRAFTKEDLRCRGIGTALLNHSLDWARSVGYKHCSVDFESTNITGSRFWLGRGFKPVCYSLVRHIEERISWAHEGRDDADLLSEF